MSRASQEQRQMRATPNTKLSDAASRARRLAEQAREAVDCLRACSPRTLYAISSELATSWCQPCSAAPERCDACEARQALVNLLNALAALLGGRL
jgi:hypothetical protein